MKPDFTLCGVSRIFIARAAELLPALVEGERVVVVTDQAVEPHAAALLPEVARIVIGQGEAKKNLATVEAIHRQLIALGADRSTLLVAVGGGIVTDTAGFAASTYMRGIRFGFVSTTLLGQVDAAIGGKNGVNVDRYKNMAGTFRQPEFVLCDPSLLATLPEREFRAGLAEVVKSAIIGAEGLFEQLEQRSFAELRSNERLLSEVVRAAAGVKVRIVERDECEQGERRLLNLGHTPAHAVEKCSTVMNHGEAVAAGIALMCRVAVGAGWLEETVAARIEQLLQHLGFTLQAPVAVSQLLAEMGKDKKSAGEQIHLVVPRAIGRCEVVTMKKTALAELF